MTRIGRWTRYGLLLTFAAAMVVGPLVPNGLVAQPQQPPPPLPVLEQNRDANGFIRVHEQGTANVNVTSGSLNVGGAVSVTNFPATQNVFVTGGTLDAASLTPVAEIHDYNMILDEGTSSGFIPLNTTFNAVVITAASTYDNEGSITFYSPMISQNAPIFEFVFGEPKGWRVESFAHAVPINGLSFYCSQGAFGNKCGLFVRIMTP